MYQIKGLFYSIIQPINESFKLDFCLPRVLKNCFCKKHTSKVIKSLFYLMIQPKIQSFNLTLLLAKSSDKLFVGKIHREPAVFWRKLSV